MRKTIEQHKRWKDDPSKGEVFTPEELVREMLDKIPTSIWENPKSTFLDPCMGKGTFLIDILRRLTTIYGYSKEDAMSRIYGYDVRVKYPNYLQRGGFINVFHKDFLSEKLDMKFHVVVGNPPYQETHEDGRSKKNALRLWAKFTISIFQKDLLKPNGYLSFVTPSGWAGSSSQVFKELKKYDLLSADFSSSISKSFNNVGGTMVFTTFVVRTSKKNPRNSSID
jgi:type I restriction-modification system DNA methylase subunit